MILRWRAHFHLNPEARSTQQETYGFRTKRPPPHIAELESFESEMLKLTQNVKFNNNKTEFQRKLEVDVASIKNDPKMLVKADKTTNYYKLTTDEYNNLLEKNITKGYKKATEQQTKQVEQAEKTTAKALALEDRMEAMAPKQAFITLKDHKPNFQNDPSCRLINPAKSELGKVSKQILDRINSQIKNNARLNQWKNTTEVLDWFNSSVKTERTTFITFDVCEFYPSITEHLLNKALDFAQQFANITQQERDIITLAKKSLLFHNNKCFAKKTPPTYSM